MHKVTGTARRNIQRAMSSISAKSKDWLSACMRENEASEVLKGQEKQAGNCMHEFQNHLAQK